MPGPPKAESIEAHRTRASRPAARLVKRCPAEPGGLSFRPRLGDGPRHGWARPATAPHREGNQTGCTDPRRSAAAACHSPAPRGHLSEVELIPAGGVLLWGQQAGVGPVPSLVFNPNLIPRLQPVLLFQFGEALGPEEVSQEPDARVPKALGRRGGRGVERHRVQGVGCNGTAPGRLRPLGTEGLIPESAFPIVAATCNARSI